MSYWGDTSEVPPQVASESDSLQSPNSTLLSSDPSSDGTDAWFSPSQPHNETAGWPQNCAKVPPLALPGSEHTELARHTIVLTTVPPDTPDLAEAGPAAPAYAFKKPPRPLSKQTRKYERSSLADTDHVPVSWIGDSIDHADYRPTNTASFSNHEADIVRVATFSTMGNKHEGATVLEGKHLSEVSTARPRRRWSLWAVLGVAAGTAIGVAYKVLGDNLDINAIGDRQIRHAMSARPVDTHVSLVSSSFEPVHLLETDYRLT